MTIAPLMPIFQPYPLAFSHGKGCYLYTAAGEEYLDFASGLAVNVLGHSHPELTAVLHAQGEKLWHASNLYHIPEREQLAQMLVDCSFADTVFFGSSGAEVVECALKIAQRYHQDSGRYRMISFERGYHGRTMAALAASHRPAARKGYSHLPEGYDFVEFNNLAAVAAAIGPETAAIILEPIQGEGGLHVASTEFLQGIRALADQHDLLIIYDEIQSGLARCGTLFAYEQLGVAPDIMTLAKGLGNGFPIGACLASEKAARNMTAGSHSGTFSGNPLGTAIAAKVMQVINQPSFLKEVVALSAYLHSKLSELAAQFPSLISGVRGRGLMLGLVVSVPANKVVYALQQAKLLTVPTENQVVRIYPPLIVTQEQIDDAVARMQQVFAELVTAS